LPENTPQLSPLVQRLRISKNFDAPRLFAGQVLPALDDDVDVLLIKLDAVADAFR
jgi:hypothetical protein